MLIGCADASLELFECRDAGEPFPSPPTAYDDGYDARQRCELQPGSLTRDSVGAGAPSLAAVKHVVVLLHENHSFDNYFGAWQAPAGQTVEVAGPTTSTSIPRSRRPTR